MYVTRGGSKHIATERRSTFRVSPGRLEPTLERRYASSRTGKLDLVAAVDIGSNTVRLLVASCVAGGIQPKFEKSRFVSLGLKLERTGKLDAKCAEAAIRAVTDFTERARTMGVFCPVVFATSAVREAGNGGAFVRRCGKRAGVPIRVLSGREEAEFTWLGATAGTAVDHETVVVDLGGGSTEIVAGGPDGMRWAHSIPLGSRRLTDCYVSASPPTLDELARVHIHAMALMRSLPPASPRTLILSGGTAAQIIRMVGPRSRVACLPADTVHAAATIATSISAREATNRFGIRRRRAEVLPAGLQSLDAIVRHFSPVRVIVTRQGIRDGMLIDSFQRDNDWPAA